MSEDFYNNERVAKIQININESLLREWADMGDQMLIQCLGKKAKDIAKSLLESDNAAR